MKCTQHWLLLLFTQVQVSNMCHPQFAARLSTVQTLLDPMKSMCSYHPTEVRRLSGPIELYPMRSVCAWWPSYFVVRLLTCRWISHFVRRGQCDTRPTVTFPAAVHHCHVTGTNLSFLVRVLSATSSRGLYVVGKGRWVGCWLIDVPLRLVQQTEMWVHRCVDDVEVK